MRRSMRNAQFNVVCNRRMICKASRSLSVAYSNSCRLNSKQTARRMISGSASTCLSDGQNGTTLSSSRIDPASLVVNAEIVRVELSHYAMLLCAPIVLKCFAALGLRAFVIEGEFSHATAPLFGAHAAGFDSRAECCLMPVVQFGSD